MKHIIYLVWSRWHHLIWTLIVGLPCCSWGIEFINVLLRHSSRSTVFVHWLNFSLVLKLLPFADVARLQVHCLRIQSYKLDHLFKPLQEVASSIFFWYKLFLFVVSYRLKSLYKDMAAGWNTMKHIVVHAMEQKWYAYCFLLNIDI